MNLFFEGLYLFSQIFFFGRLYFQTKASKKEKRSVNPEIFWTLGIIGNVCLLVYGYLTGGIVMMGTSTFGAIYAWYHLRLTKKWGH